jgi:4-hydroxy-tetrahydrodipicolinate synthase
MVKMVVFSGCYTALITPMTTIREVDYEGLRSLVEFQIREGVSGILAVGTTGESPTLDWNEHNKVIERVHEYTGGKGVTIAGTGSNSTQETIEGTAHAQHIGINCVLLVDPYYNGPSSLEIRKEYVNFPKSKSSPTLSQAEQALNFYPKTSRHSISSTRTSAQSKKPQAICRIWN